MPVPSALSANATLDGAGQLPANGSTPAADASPVSHGSTVSRAEVFGIFLTLSLCLLSQPTGSLVYRPHSILPWRLNPLASLAEAVLILTCFTTVIVASILGSPSTASIWTAPWSHHGDGSETCQHFGEDDAAA